MKTTHLYITEPECYHGSARIIEKGKDDYGLFYIFDQTLFYPQGGGQPSDIGYIECAEIDLPFPVRSVRYSPLGDIHHYVDQRSVDFLEIGDVISMVVDADKRLLHARYHTAAHWLGHMVEAKEPTLKAIKGHAFPSEAYVEWEGTITEGDGVGTWQAYLDQKSAYDIEKNPIVKSMCTDTPELALALGKIARQVQCGDYSPLPCGGIHVNNLTHVGRIVVRKAKRKGALLRLSFEIV